MTVVAYSRLKAFKVNKDIFLESLLLCIITGLFTKQRGSVHGAGGGEKMWQHSITSYIYTVMGAYASPTPFSFSTEIGISSSSCPGGGGPIAQVMMLQVMLLDQTNIEALKILSLAMLSGLSVVMIVFSEQWNHFLPPSSHQ